MSLEQVLLIVFIVVLPLIQYLMRMSRQRNELPEPAESLPPSAHQPPMRELQPPATTEDRTLSEAVITAERKPARNAGAPVALRIRRSARRGTAAVGLHDPLDLRRAIVLMTVLESCRAIHPHDGPDRAGR
jgi:hypothetical protein